MKPTIFTTLLVALALTLTGCTSTKYVPMERVRTEYVEADTAAIYNRALRAFESLRDRERSSDSLVDRSRETVVLNEQGDTTRHDRERIIYRATHREKELERKVIEQDSIIGELRERLSSVKVDSVPVPYPVEKKLTCWQQTKMDLGGIAIGAVGAVCLAVLLWLIFLYLRRKR